MSKRVIAIVATGLVLMCLLCGVGTYLLGVNTLRGYREITQTASRFLTLLRQSNFQNAVQMIEPSVRAKLTEAELRRRWQTFVTAVGEPQSWSAGEFRIFMTSNRQTATLRMSVRGRKGVGSVEFELLSNGTEWQITKLRFVW
jgi:hypothetical protein